MRRTLRLATVGVAVVACSTSEAPERERTGRSSSAIVGGQLDTTHDAVVLLLLQDGEQGGLCSGTIVKTDPATHIGWVVTAAHCAKGKPVLVVQGASFANRAGTIRYAVIDVVANPAFDAVNAVHDVAVIRIAGVDATTPTIALAEASDGLAAGASVVSVGYGLSSANVEAGVEDPVRRNVTKALRRVDSVLEYDMRTSGICQGDSGGPVLTNVGGREVVAGVHSYTVGGCSGSGVSERVSAELAFLDGELAKAPPPEDCTLCSKIVDSGHGVCTVPTDRCLADKDCAGYSDCMSAVGGSRDRCASRFPKGEGPYAVAAACVCLSGCVTQCKSVFSCTTTPRCIYKPPTATCRTCMEGACCAEATACASDGACYLCLSTKDAAASCATNSARKTLATCVASKCQAECAGTGLDRGAEALAAQVGEADAGVESEPESTSGCAIARRSEDGTAAVWVVAVAAFAVGRRRRRGRVTEGDRS